MHVSQCRTLVAAQQIAHSLTDAIDSDTATLPKKTDAKSVRLIAESTWGYSNRRHVKDSDAVQLTSPVADERLEPSNC